MALTDSLIGLANQRMDRIVRMPMRMSAADKPPIDRLIADELAKCRRRNVADVPAEDRPVIRRRIAPRRLPLRPELHPREAEPPRIREQARRRLRRRRPAPDIL